MVDKSAERPDGPTSDHHTVTWHDAGFEPKCAPNPAYPNGCHLQTREPGAEGCLVELPYPAKRIGHYTIECRRCMSTTCVTTAGRPDDPVTIVVQCAAPRD